MSDSTPETQECHQFEPISIQVTVGECRRMLHQWGEYLPRLIKEGAKQENTPARQQVFALLCASNGLQVALFQAAQQGLTQDEQVINFTTMRSDPPVNIVPMNPEKN